MVRFGLSLGAFYGSAKEILSVCETAANRGFDSIWLPDSQLVYRDPFPMLGALARSLKRATLGTLVTNPHTRHFSVIASSIATVNEISQGRVILGVGVGDSSVRMLGRRPSTVDDIAHFVRSLRSLMSGGVAEDCGHRFSLRWKSETVPIYLAATARKMQSAAGEYADGVVLNVGSDAKLIHNAIDMVNQGRSKTSKQRFEYCSLVFCSVYENPKKAYDIARPSVAWFYVNHPALLKRAGIRLTGEQSRIDLLKSDYLQYDLVHSDDWQRAQKVSDFIPDDIVRRLALTGSPNDCRKAIEEQISSGIEHIIIRPPSTEHWKEIFQTFSERILPSFK